LFTNFISKHRKQGKSIIGFFQTLVNIDGFKKSNNIKNKLVMLKLPSILNIFSFINKHKKTIAIFFLVVISMFFIRCIVLFMFNIYLLIFDLNSIMDMKIYIYILGLLTMPISLYLLNIYKKYFDKNQQLNEEDRNFFNERVTNKITIYTFIFYSLIFFIFSNYIYIIILILLFLFILTRFLYNNRKES
jgi:hypothetical protein